MAVIAERTVRSNGNLRIAPGAGQGVSAPSSKSAGNDQGDDRGIPVAGQVELCHLLSGAQEPKQRGAYYQTRQMH